MKSYNIEISRHAYSRIHERMGLNKCAAMRIASKAYSLGIRHAETSGNLFDFIAAESMAYMHKGSDIRIYGEMVYCFVRQPLDGGEIRITLLTVFHLPQRLKNNALGMQKKKKALFVA